MRKYINQAKTLATSKTAKDTYILFSGNLLSAFLGFLFTLIVARAVSVEDFGILSATLNLVIIVSSLTDLGTSSGVVNFVSQFVARKEEAKVESYTKAALIIRLVAVTLFVLLIIFLAPYISRKLLATTDPSVSYWAAAISFGIFLPLFMPFVLQARKRFLASVVVDNSLYLARLIATLIFLFLGSLTIGTALGSYFLGCLVSVVVGFGFIGIRFLRSKTSKKIYTNILRYSGWLGVNRIVSSISGRLDVQMLAAIAGATATGLYSIPSRLASFIVVLTASFSSVLATRMAAFGDREKEKKYLLKATLATAPIVIGILFWIVIANPFIIFLFGDKYQPAVPIFQALVASMIPFLLTAPSVTAITYAMKKTVYIGAYSFFQLAAIFVLNYILIPRFGVFGPTITFGLTNSILAIYTWSIVIKHYWFDK